MLRKIFITVMTAALILLCLASVTGAAVQPLRIDPSRFIFEGKPGDELSGSITVSNTGTGGTSPKAVLSDWTLTATNQLDLLEAGTLDSTLSGWVKFNPRQFSLKAKAGQLVRFTIRIPRDAPPGERRGMISFDQSAPYQGPDSGAEAKIRVTSTIYVAVLPVERKCEAIGASLAVNANEGTTGVVLTLKGTGNAHFRGTAEFQVFKDGARTPVGEGKFEPLVVLPGVETRFTGTWKGRPTTGTYQVAVKIQSDEPKAAPITKLYEYVQK